MTMYRPDRVVSDRMMQEDVAAPAGWRKLRFDAFAVLQRGFDLPSSSRTDGAVPVIGSNGIVGKHDVARVDGPGVVTGRSGSIGESIYVESNFWPLNTALYISDFCDNFPRFVQYFLQWFNLARFKSGVSVPTLNRNSVHGSEVVIPPIPEQQKIAAVLWKLQRAVATQDRLIKATRDLKQSAMQRLFTCGLRGEPLKDTEIGAMPESWNPRPLPELCDIWSGGTPRKSIAEYWQGPIPWVSGKDLKSVTLDDAIDHVSPTGVAAGSRLAPADSVLLLVRGMGLAKDLPVAVISRPMAFNQDIKALMPRGEYSGSFIRSAIYVGKERLRSRIVPSAHGTMTLNLDDLHSFQLACPPADTDEAADIAAALATIDRKLSHHQRKRAALDDLFQSTLHQLMTAQIRVADLDIDTSEVADHVPGAGSMIESKPDADNRHHVVEVNNVMAGDKRAVGKNHAVGANKMMIRERKPSADFF